ncbi:hypothetical protein DPMN_136507 [Dreissena polymorpha]|uniref:Uncharacterized protein n=1 Tax=Dreissena polymorpha TaxID=45954 RepID=A0A9D4G0Y8_DREPO|nr:hypothetical protein DPMN_136507 [Dreissena polymorpha]
MSGLSDQAWSNSTVAWNQSWSNSTVAWIMEQQYCGLDGLSDQSWSNSTVAWIMEQQYCGLDHGATVLWPGSWSNSTVAWSTLWDKAHCGTRHTVGQGTWIKKSFPRTRHNSLSHQATTF